MNWELVEESFNEGTRQTVSMERVAIAGGWLVRDTVTVTEGGDNYIKVTVVSTSITFVTDPNYKWRI